MTESRPPVGTLAWAALDGGRLSSRERIAALNASSRVVGPMMAARLRRLLGATGSGGATLDPDAFVLPDSAIARAAAQEALETTGAMLHHHSVRTYLWGLALAQVDGLTPDRELLYVASMLHDITLGDTHREHSPTPCFAARGAEFALSWTADQGWPEERGRTCAEAICLHLNSSVDPAYGPEAVLLNAGAGLDILGLRYDQVHRDAVRLVLEDYPRLGLKKAIPAVFGAESHRGTRARFLIGLGFKTMARTSPFSE